MKVLAVLICGLFLAGCASNNVSKHWDCPAQSGYGCVDMERADEEAMQDLKRRRIKRPLQGSAGIWFAPFIREVEK